MRILLILVLFMQEKGDKAPEFALKNQADKEVKLADFKDKKHVLLAFYPKDATPG